MASGRAQDDPRIEALLSFWLGAPRDGGAADAAVRERWFSADPAFDDECRRRFGGDLERAARGELDGWAATPRGRLALIVLLDQLSRNVHRGTARAFSQDARALALCREGMARGDDRRLGPFERIFFYMPLEHAEDLEAQRRSVASFEALAAEAPSAERALFEELLDYARRHLEVIERFGRFPHRNRLLGRAPRPGESDFLAEHASGF